MKPKYTTPNNTIGPTISNTGTWTIAPIGASGIYRPDSSSAYIEANKEFMAWSNDNWKHINNLLAVLDKLDLL